MKQNTSLTELQLLSVRKQKWLPKNSLILHRNAKEKFCKLRLVIFEVNHLVMFTLLFKHDKPTFNAYLACKKTEEIGNDKTELTSKCTFLMFVILLYAQILRCVKKKETAQLSFNLHNIVYVIFYTNNVFVDFL